MSTPGVSIYYTLDGSDPRLPGGGINSSAILYSGPIIITDSTLVRVRAQSGSTWSALDEAQFIVGSPASISNLTVSELNYHPADPTADELDHNALWTDARFRVHRIEEHQHALQIDLTGVHFTAGIIFDFTAGTVLDLAPGGYVLVVSNLEAFTYRYGSALLPQVAGHTPEILATAAKRSRWSIIRMRSFSVSPTTTKAHGPRGATATAPRWS